MDMERKIYCLSPAQRKRVKELIKHELASMEEVRFAFLFGSFVDDSDEGPLPFHDIDLGIYLSGLEEKESLYYAFDLMDRLSSLAGVKVDVRVLNYAPVTFLFHVVRGELLIDKDEDSRCAFTERVVRHYLDMEPLLHRAIKEAYGP